MKQFPLPANHAQDIAKFINTLTRTASDDMYFCVTLIAFGESKAKERIKNRTVTIGDWRTNPQETIAFIKQWCEFGYNAYIMPTLAHTAPGANNRANKSIIEGGFTLWADIDLPENERVIARENPAKFVAEYLKLENKPSMIVFTGRGFHLYWSLDTYEEVYQEIEKRNKRLKTELKADNCWDASHILRIPATYNYKKDFGDTPASVKLLHFDDSLQYPISSFRIEELENDTISELAVNEEPLPDDFLERLPNELRDRILLGPVGESDRSKNDWFVARKLIESNFTPGQVYSVFCHPTWEVGSKGQSNNSYIIRTIQKAVADFKAQAYIKSEAVLQPLIEKHMINRDKNNKVHIDIPAQSLPMVKDICMFLVENGYRFIYDKNEKSSYIITPNGDVLKTSTSSKEFIAWLCTATMFTPDAKAFRTLLTGIVAYASNISITGETHPWSYLNPNTNEWRILLDHVNARTVIRCIPGEEITREPNGQKGVMLTTSPRTNSQVIDWDTNDYDWNVVLAELINLCFDNFPVSEISKRFLICYMLALPIASGLAMHSLLPMLHLTGKAGSGKTNILQTISAFIHGTVELESGSTGAGIHALAQRDFFLPFDDYEKLPEYLQEFILTNATGAVRHKIGNVEDNTIVSQHTHTLLALTSISDIDLPTLRRRTIQIGASSALYSNAKYDDGFKNKIVRNRARYWNAYIRFINEHILNHINAAHINTQGRIIASLIPVQEYRPLAPFLAIVFEIGKALSVIDVKFNECIKVPYVVNYITEFNLTSSENFVAQNPLFEPIQQLVAVASRYKHRNGDARTLSFCGAPVVKTLGDGLVIEENIGFIPNLDIESSEDWSVMSGLASSFAIKFSNMGYRQLFNSSGGNLGVTLSKWLKELMGTNNMQFLLNNGLERGDYKYSPLIKFGVNTIFLQYAQNIKKRHGPCWRIWYYNPATKEELAEQASKDKKPSVTAVLQRLLQIETDPENKLALIRMLAKENAKQKLAKEPENAVSRQSSEE